MCSRTYFQKRPESSQYQRQYFTHNSNTESINILIDQGKNIGTVVLFQLIALLVKENIFTKYQHRKSTFCPNNNKLSLPKGKRVKSVWVLYFAFVSINSSQRITARARAISRQVFNIFPKIVVNSLLHANISTAAHSSYSNQKLPVCRRTATGPTFGQD